MHPLGLGYSALAMAQFDPERERQRLAARYAAMSDEELRGIADDVRSLTDEAKAALRAEFYRRGLSLTLKDTELIQHLRGPIVLRRYLWLADALLAQSMLESADIECVLADEHTIRMNWLWSLALGEVRLWVKAEDADVIGLLDQGWVESFVVSGVGRYVQPRCPNCGSFEISYRNLVKRFAYFTLLLCWFLAIIPPIPLRELAWRCYACGHLWEEENQSAPQEH
jgi:hypothetical protein